MSISLEDQLANEADEREGVNAPVSTTTSSVGAHHEEQQTEGGGEDVVDGVGTFSFLFFLSASSRLTSRPSSTASPSLDRPILTPEHRRLNAEHLATLDGTALAAIIAFREAHKNNTPEELIAHLRMFAAMGEEHRRERAEAGRT